MPICRSGVPVYQILEGLEAWGYDVCFPGNVESKYWSTEAGYGCLISLTSASNFYIT